MFGIILVVHTQIFILDMAGLCTCVPLVWLLYRHVCLSVVVSGFVVSIACCTLDSGLEQ